MVIATAAAGVAAEEPLPATPVLVAAMTQVPAPPARVASPFRIVSAILSDDPSFRIDDPRSMLRSGYGGSMVDLFPFEGGKFHLSGGGHLFGRAGRPRPVAADPESLRYLQPFRAGALRAGRRFSPAMLVGYGRTVEQGLAIGIDAGLVMGRVGVTPDRLTRHRLYANGARGRMNELARVTALYRF